MRLKVIVPLILALAAVAFTLGVQRGSSQPAQAAHGSARAGVLAGVRLGPRAVARFAHVAGFRDNDLFIAVAVAGGESWLYTKAHNDNTLAIAKIPDGTVVRNVETGEPITVLDNSIGKIRLSDGSTVTVPLTVEYVVSRDVGLWEINIPASQIGTSVESNLYDPAANVAAAFRLWSARKWQPWAAYNSGAYLRDTYRQWAALGVANLWMADTNAEAQTFGLTPLTHIPWITIPQLRKLYPAVPLG